MHRISLLIALTIACFVGTSQAAEPTKIFRGEPRFIKEVPHGRLEQIGQGEDAINLLFIWGTPHEMGKAHGQILKEEIQGHFNLMLELMTQKMKSKPDALDDVFNATKPHMPPYFLEEMAGLAEGAGLPLQTVHRCEIIGEASEWHCSLFGTCGTNATANGHTYQLRSLDYMVGANIQKHPTIVVYIPSQGHPFANIGWSGIIGSVTGISSAQLGISEIGDDYDAANDSFDGIPFMFMLRDILQFDNHLQQALDRVKNAKRTSSLMYAVGDGKAAQVRGLQTSRTIFNVFGPENLEPNLPTHPRLNNFVYWGMSWDVPKFDKPLHDELAANAGKLTPEIVVGEILPKVRTGNLQATLYDLTDLKIWTANAKADTESGPLNAYERQFVEIDLKKQFARGQEFAKRQ